MAFSLRFAAIGAAALALTGCAVDPRPFPAPDSAAYQSAELTGYSNIRYYGDAEPPHLYEITVFLWNAEQANPEMMRNYDILALSGGADDGAYGAGLLKGWSDRGDRPDFELVTGVSTGALIAPFAYLGPDYDDEIKRFYTETSQDDVFSLDLLSPLLGGSSIGDTEPLKKILSEEITPEFVEKLAAAHRSGRMLLVGTTNLDAQRQVTWDIGLIASSGQPSAPQLIQKILLASASIPGAFPPVFIDVEIDGVRHQELHVDGGVTQNIFAYPPAIDAKKIIDASQFNETRTMWLIRNTKIHPDYKPVKPGFAQITGRSVSTLIKYQGRGDLLALENLAKRDQFDFQLAHVPQDFDMESEEMFDPAYMNALYEIGYKAAQNGVAWKTEID